MLNLMYVLICNLIDVLLLLLLLCECTLWGEREQTALNHCIATDISRVTIYDIIGKTLPVKYRITARFAQEFFLQAGKLIHAATDSTIAGKKV